MVTPSERPAEERLNQRCDRGLAEEADADRGHRDPELARREDLIDLLELLEHLVHPGLALLGEGLEAPATAADQRELGGNEQAVDGHQQEQRTERERRHRAEGDRAASGSKARDVVGALLLRGRSSSTGTSRR